MNKQSKQVQQIKCNAILPRGWEFNSADFSLSPTVSLQRDFNGMCWWHTLTEVEQDQTPFYVIGVGNDLQSCIDDAIKQIEKINSNE